ncbi:MAG: MBOAT family protein, partial [Atopobiaceae bacterium]|nr:MBOAT family protein [Atopobiaceae bacterium]
GWYFDRIEDVGTSIFCLGKTFTDFAPQRFVSSFLSLGIGHGKVAQLLLALIAVLVVFAVSVMQERGIDVSDTLLKSSPLMRAAVCLFVGFLIVASFTFNVGGGFMYANY